LNLLNIVILLMGNNIGNSFINLPQDIHCELAQYLTPDDCINCCSLVKTNVIPRYTCGHEFRNFNIRICTIKYLNTRMKKIIKDDEYTKMDWISEQFIGMVCVKLYGRDFWLFDDPNLYCSAWITNGKTNAIFIMPCEASFDIYHKIIYFNNPIDVFAAFDRVNSNNNSNIVKSKIIKQELSKLRMSNRRKYTSNKKLMNSTVLAGYLEMISRFSGDLFNRDFGL